VWDSSGNFSQMGNLYNGLLTTLTSNCHTSGKINGAFLFNGSTHYVLTQNNTSLNFTNGISDLPFSISAWIKQDDLTGTQTIACKEDVWQLLSFNGQIGLTLKNGVDFNYCLTTTSISVNEWNYIVINYDGVNFTVIINTYPMTITSGIIGSYTTMSNNLSGELIGADKTSGIISYYFSGEIDNILVADRILTNYEIEGLWNRGRGTEGCYGLYQFTSSSSDSSTSVNSNSSSSSTSIDSNSSSSLT
jgi:hypothetical protein